MNQDTRDFQTSPRIHPALMNIGHVILGQVGFLRSYVPHSFSRPCHELSETDSTGNSADVFSPRIKLTASFLTIYLLDHLLNASR